MLHLIPPRFLCIPKALLTIQRSGKQAAQDLTKNIKILKSELSAAGKSGTPIYGGEIGSVYTKPGKQSMPITQGLYAGQVLGELLE